MIKLSLATVLLLGVSSLSADKNIEAEVSIYAQNIDVSGTNKDSGYSVGSISIDYITNSFNNFTGNFGVRANHKITEKEKEDYEDDNPSAIVSIANISYENENLKAIAGKQEIDLEWIGDFHNALTVDTSILEDTELIFGYTNGLVVADNDAPLESYTRVVDKNGKDSYAYFIDVKYRQLSNVVINPYFLSSKDLFKGYGLKVEFEDIQKVNFLIHLAKSDEDVQNTQNGYILNLESSYSILDTVETKFGYIQTDKDGGIGSLASYGDNINPFEEGNYVYNPDSDTFYLGAEAQINEIGISALYGVSEYGTNNNREREFDISFSYEFYNNIESKFVFTDINGENNSDDITKISALVAYKF